MSSESSISANNSQKLSRRVHEFFFAEEIPYGIALIRICLPLLLLSDVLRRWPYARELFSSDGATTPLADAYGYFNFLPEFSGTVVVALYTALAFFLVATSLGWFTRVSLLACTLLYPYFCMLDMLGSITKYVVISTHILLLMNFSRPGLIWSVDAWLARRRREPQPLTTPVWPRRLIGLLIAVTYFGAAITKMHTPSYFSGEQMQFWMMSNIYYNHPLGDFLALYPGVGVTVAYIALVWEILFIVCCWNGWGRRWMLGLGAAFHFGTFVMLGIIIFPLIMLCSYFSYLNQQDAAYYAPTVRRWLQRFGMSGSSIASSALPETSESPSPAVATAGVPVMVFLCALCLFALSGVAVEHWQDRYGIRHPDGRYALQPMPEEEVRRLLTSDVTIREQDKYLSLTVGDSTFGGHVCNIRDKFHVDERILIQASLNPPHEDMWVECNLHDEQDNQLSRVGQIVPRENQRAFYNYRLDESYDPGTYHLVLKSAGQEVMRKTITLLPSQSKSEVRAPVAN